MKPPTLFAELCAGTAAVSLKLHGGKHARPPVSRLGAKTGYASAILKVMGLRAGLGAEHYLWCEPDAGCRLLLEAYRDHDLALAAAEIIRGWKDEEPRALWERLRAEGPVRAPEPREVARWTWLVLRSVAFKGPQAGYMPGDAEDGSGRWVNTPEQAAGKWDGCPTLPATILPDACTVHPPRFPAGHRVIAFMDPPYVGTTGYASDLPRAEVVRIAREWADAGADVYISEAEPIPELVADGWHKFDISSTRRGQKRTFSKQQAEWLTCNRAPAWTPGAVRQRALFTLETA